MKKQLLYVALALLVLASCKKNVDAEKALDVSVPVTLTAIDTSGISSYTDLNAIATFIVKTSIKANTTGYLSAVNVASNDYVNQGKVLFTLKTREAKVLGNTINKIDSSLNFGNAIPVTATSNGFVNAINVQQGDYVQDGDVLAVINDVNSFALVLSLPYELKKYIHIGQQLDATLPDGTALKATVQKLTPSVDATSQTQNIILKVDRKYDIPENLVVKVRIPKASSRASISLPKAAVLSDETEMHFWIMKLINATTAVKVPVTKGIETDDRVEIIAPKLTIDDRILLTGNYGVADTIKVKVIKN